MLNLKFRKPDEVIGEKYMRRWHLRRNSVGNNLYLHYYEGSDDDRALHDHPWKSVGIVLWGNLVEVTEQGEKRLWPLWPKVRRAEYAHRLILKSRFAITLFYTGKKTREWGFYSPDGWMHWSKFISKGGSQSDAGFDN